MDDGRENVKYKWVRRLRVAVWCARKRLRAVKFMDEHPRVGWFIAFLSALNVVLNLLQLAH